ATIRTQLRRWLRRGSLRRRPPTPQSPLPSPPCIWTRLVAPLRALTLNAHLRRWLRRGSLRRRRPTPQSPLPSPPRIWTRLVAPLRPPPIHPPPLPRRA